MNRHIPLTGSLILSLAGSATPLGAQQGEQPERRDSKMSQPDTRREMRTDRQAQAHRLDFHRFNSLKGTDVIDGGGETLGSLSDLIIDRGSGRIEYGLVSYGGVLGVGSESVAVPYDEFTFDDAKKRFRLGATKDQFEKGGVMPASWVSLEKESWDEQLFGWIPGAYEDRDRELIARDPYADAFKGSSPETLTGTVQSVHRKDRHHDQEQVKIVLRDDKNQAHTVILGPSWYVLTQANAPMRGDRVTVTAVPISSTDDERYWRDYDRNRPDGYRDLGERRPGQIDRNGMDRPRDADRDRVDRPAADKGDLYLATSVKNDRGETLQLREADGATRWTGQRMDRSIGDGGTTQLVLLTDVVGADVQALGEDAGEVQDVVIERQSGRVALLLLDPNENFLGLADTLRVVPWTVSRVGADEVVRVDASKDMLAQCEETPDDLTVYTRPGGLQPVYGVFATEVYDFRPREPRMWREGETLGGWAGDSGFAQAFQKGEATTISGAVVRSSTLRPTDKMTAGKSLIVSTDKGEQTVLLGPASFLDRQDMPCKDGDQVTVHARRITLDGKELLVAESISANGKTVTVMDDRGNPVWINR